MTVRLRGHHLLCMLAYVGRGYTPAFCANFDGITRRLADGEDVLLVDGPDDVCAPIALDPGAHCLRDSARRRDGEALAAIGRTPDLAWRAGDRIRPTAGMIVDLRKRFTGAGVGEPGLRRACGGCEWSSLCTGIAEAGYPGVRLRPQA